MSSEHFALLAFTTKQPPTSSMDHGVCGVLRNRTGRGDSELCGGGVVLKNLSEQVRECLRHAMIVREKLPPLKLIHTNFLDLEQR
jgi:hypothetical protein